MRFAPVIANAGSKELDLTRFTIPIDYNYEARGVVQRQVAWAWAWGVRGVGVAWAAWAVWR